MDRGGGQVYEGVERVSLDFGSIDPAVALKPFVLPPTPASGPIHRAQYVIELVGERTLTAETAKTLLQPDWVSALGQPQVYVMAASDSSWRLLEAHDTATAYDSVALAWDLVSSRGALTRESAEHLYKVSEHLAQQLSRRAMPLPPPTDVPRQVKALETVRDSLDIGVNLSVVSQGLGFTERDVWVACTRLGLSFGTTGLFEWRVASWPSPLLGVGPLVDVESFSLAQVQAGLRHSILDVGFHVPLSPDPLRAMEAVFYVAGFLARELGGTVLDEDDMPLNEGAQRQNLEQAIGAMRRAGVEPGSAEAFHVFG